MKKMTTAKIISALGVLAMTAVLIYGFTVGDFAADGAELLQNPWGIVSLVDLYTGFILFSAWIVYREKSITVAAFWVVNDDGARLFHRQSLRPAGSHHQQGKLEGLLDGSPGKWVD
jgi:hypothetical protein